MTPPLFGYEVLPSTPQGLVLVYESPRKLCPVLLGAIEGAAARYGERVQIVERTCMKRGAGACRFEVVFAPPISGPLHFDETPEQRARHEAKQHLADFVLSVLPASDGVTLADLQNILRSRLASPQQRRPSVLLEALHHLQHVGLVATTANQPGDNLTHRRYWRAPTPDTYPGE